MMLSINAKTESNDIIHFFLNYRQNKEKCHIHKYSYNRRIICQRKLNNKINRWHNTVYSVELFDISKIMLLYH